MKVEQIIVHRVEIDVMNDLPRRSADKLAVLPLAPTALRSVAKPAGVESLPVVPVGFFSGRAARGGLGDVDHRRFHEVAASFVLPWRKAFHLLFIRKQGVSMPVPHLVVAHAHLPRGSRAIAVNARATDDSAAPSILRRAVPLLSLVVHQTEAVCRVFSPTSIYRARLVELGRRHVFPLRFNGLIIHPYKNFGKDKTYGNSMAVRVMAWLGERLLAHMPEVQP